MSDKNLAIHCHNITKRFNSSRPTPSLFVQLGKTLLGQTKKSQKDFYALKDISLEVFYGEIFGIIGNNGSGKSTLLKVISGITKADKGDVHTYGRIVSLMEVGVGFSPLLTGRENIYLYASLLGCSREETEEVFEKIIGFSGLEASIDKAIYKYSSGMYMRLGIAVAFHSRPKILILDEALTVGDMAFQSKCIDKILELRANDVAILFVSHDLPMVSGLCDRAILLNHGNAMAYGKSEEVISQYLPLAGSQVGTYANIGNGTNQIYFNAGNAAIFSEKTALTKAYGLYTSIFALGGWHDSQQSRWTIQASEPQALQVEGEMRRLPIKQSWNLKTLPEQKIWLQIHLYLERKCYVTQIQVSILLSKIFKSCALQGKTEEAFDESLVKSWNDWVTLDIAPKTVRGKIDALAPGMSKRIRFSQHKGLLCHPSVHHTSKELDAPVLQFLHIIDKNGALPVNEDILFFEGLIEINPT